METLQANLSSSAGDAALSFQFVMNADNAWKSKALTEQPLFYQVSFEATPYETNLDGVVAFSDRAPANYSDAGILVRFATTGKLEARDGGAYSAGNTLIYSAGSSYRIRVLVDTVAKKYFVWAKDLSVPSSQEILLAKNFSYRSDFVEIETNKILHIATVAEVGPTPTAFSVQNVQVSSLSKNEIENIFQEIPDGGDSPPQEDPPSTGTPPTPPPAGTAQNCTSISQYGITWYFDKTYKCGQFVTGDWWVIGPVTIKDINPKDTDGVAPHIHGSMLNPQQTRTGCQGWDSRNMGQTQGNCYSDALNVAKKFPLTVANHSSLLSSASFPISNTAPNYGRPDDNHYPYHKSAAILTVLPAVPPAGSFRPPYIGTDKTVRARWNKTYIDYSKLAKVPPLPTTPPLAKVLEYGVEPQIEINTSWKGRYLHPAQNYEPRPTDLSTCFGNPNYGQCIALTYGDMLMAANMNYSNVQKEPIVIRLIQMGIDFYGTAINAKEKMAGVVWTDGGGHNQGRKMPVLFAGVVLNDPDLIAATDHAKSRYFQEDNQFFFVTAADVAITHRVCCVGRALEQYEASDIGMPEWGSNHVIQPVDDNRAWGASYRDNAGNSTMPHVLVAHWMGVENLWNQPAMFQYYDQRFYPRWKDRLEGSQYPNGMILHIRDLWEEYRDYEIR